jgi:hypothetical protein
MKDVTTAGLVVDDPDVDNTPAWDALLAQRPDWVHFPRGEYWFKTCPQPITCPLKISGCGPNISLLIRDYSEPDHGRALIHYQTAVAHVAGLSLLGSPGTAGGCAVKLEGECNNSILRDLRISGRAGATWDIPITLLSLTDMGIRTCRLDNLVLFNATVHLAWLVNVRGLGAQLDAYPGKGSVNHITIQGKNGGTADNVRIDTHYLEMVYLYSTRNVTITGIGNTHINQDGACANITLYQ